VTTDEAAAASDQNPQIGQPRILPHDLWRSFPSGR
jgi:hypothetical protein